MRALVIAGLTAIGVGLAGLSASLAMPANGDVIIRAVESGRALEQVRWWRRKHCWWHRRHHHWHCM